MERRPVNAEVLTLDLCELFGGHELCPGITPFDPETMEADDIQIAATQTVFCICECHQVKTLQ
jgi:hypothetical protein